MKQASKPIVGCGELCEPHQSTEPRMMRFAGSPHPKSLDWAATTENTSVVHREKGPVPSVPTYRITRFQLRQRQSTDQHGAVLQAPLPPYRHQSDLNGSE